LKNVKTSTSDLNISRVSVRLTTDPPIYMLIVACGRRYIGIPEVDVIEATGWIPYIWTVSLSAKNQKPLVIRCYAFVAEESANFLGPRLRRLHVDRWTVHGSLLVAKQRET
jgi:hypothetical protein